ncbi:15462_t:CDS:2, partial [Gigaspora rosea]
ALIYTHIHHTIIRNHYCEFSMEENSYAIYSTTTVITSQHFIGREDHNSQNNERISSLEQGFGPVNFENEKKIENEQNYKGKCDVFPESTATKSDSNDSYAIVTNDDPKNWPSAKKRCILFIVIVSGMLSPIASTILYSAIIKLRQELHTTEIVINSLVWAAYSDEFATRRKVYLVSITVFIISTIICAVARNIWLLFVMRVVQACGSSAVLSIGAGIISDIYVSTERGHAYGLFYLAYWFGPFLGPMCGGYLTEYLGWRWMFWFLAIYGGIIFLIIIFFLPETFRTVSSPIGTSSTTRFNPIAPLKLLRHPNSLRWKIFRFVLRKKKAENGGFSYPEMRINSAWGGALLVPSSLGTLIAFNSMSTYLMDAYPMHSASAIALNDCIRFIASGTVAILEPLMEDALGTGWMFTFMVSLDVISTFFILAVYFKGKEWRESMTPNLEVESNKVTDELKPDNDTVLD